MGVNQQTVYFSDINMRSGSQVKTQEREKRLQARVIESDNKMVEQTIILLSEGGVSAVTLEAVGVNAGYSRGLVSRRYGCKDGLLIRVLNILMQWADHHIEDVTAERTGLDAINALVLALAGHINTELIYYRAYFGLWFYGLENYAVTNRAVVSQAEENQPEPHPTEMNQALQQVQQCMLRRILTWLEQAQAEKQLSKHADLEMMADLILAPVVGLIHQWMIDANFNIELRLKQLVNFQFRTIFTNSHVFHAVNYWGE